MLMLLKMLKRIKVNFQDASNVAQFAFHYKDWKYMRKNFMGKKVWENSSVTNVTIQMTVQTSA